MDQDCKFSNKLWNVRYMRERAVLAFLNFQDAIASENISKVDGFLSESQKNKILDYLTSNKEKNIKFYLPHIEISSFQISQIMDNGSDEEGAFSVSILYYATGYSVNSNTNQITSGSKTQKKKFYEHWMFVIKNNDWIVSEIFENIPIGGTQGRFYTSV